MNQTELQSKVKKQHKSKRLGRGNASGKGTYSGRGCKGQKSRSGKTLRPGFEGGQTPLVRRMPKLPGFKSMNVKPEVINITDIEKFKNGTVVNKKLLVKEKLVKLGSKVKLLGYGNLTKKLTIHVDYLSKSAKQKIEKVGGEIIVDEEPKKHVKKDYQTTK